MITDILIYTDESSVRLKTFTSGLSLPSQDPFIKAE